MDKLIIPNVKPLTAKQGNTVRAILDDDTYEELKATAEKSGISISQLAGIYVRFGNERAVVGDGVIVEEL